MLFDAEVEKLRPAGRELAKACADYYMSSSEDQLRMRIAKIMRDFPDLSYAVHVDREGKAHRRPESKAIDSLIERLPGIDRDRRDWTAVEFGGKTYIDIADVTPTRPPLRVHIGFAKSLLSRRVHGLLLHQGAIVLIVLAGGLSGAFLLSVWLTRPVVELSSVAERMSLGDMDVRLDLKYRGEIGRVYRSLERLRESVLYALRRLDSNHKSAGDNSSSQAPVQDKLAKGEGRWRSPT